MFSGSRYKRWKKKHIGRNNTEIKKRNKVGEKKTPEKELKHSTPRLYLVPSEKESTKLYRQSNSSVFKITLFLFSILIKNELVLMILLCVLQSSITFSSK